MLWNVLREIRYAARTLARNPGFAIVPVVALALGIGANTAIFSVLNAYLLRPLPYGDSDRLAMVREVRNAGKRISRSPNLGEFLEWRAQKRSIEELAAFRYYSLNLTGQEAPELVLGLQVSEGFFRLLRVKPAKGRDFLAEEYQPGRDRVVILSDGLWRGRFAGRPDILGQPIGIGGAAFTVVGVMPPGFRFPGIETRLWVPMAFGPERREQTVFAILRLKPGVSMKVAGAELGAISCSLESSDRAEAAGWDVTMRTLYDVLNHVREASPSLIVIALAVAFVLLIACANIANLLLARGAVRAKEMAVRMALGASRGRLIREMLVESVLLALAGGCFGVLLGHFGAKAIVAAAPSWMLPVADIQVDAAVLAYTAAISILSGLVFGLVPAWQGSRPWASETLKEGGRSSIAGRGRLRRALVVFEVAPALVLLISAGLLMKSIARMQQVDLGYQPENLLTMDLVLSPAKYQEPHQRADLITWAQDRIERIPGVVAAGASATVSRRPVLVQGRPAPLPGQELYVLQRAVSTDHFRALGIPLRRGRFFSDRDIDGALPVAIVNETMARQLWPDQDPVGSMIRAGGGKPGPWLTIVGVVGDERRNALGATWPEMFVPHRQDPPYSVSFVVRSAGKPTDLAPTIREAIRERDRDQPVSNIRTMEQALADSVAPQRITTYCLGVFAAIAISLAVIGLYGVISYGVAQRTRELGLRAALGASPGDLLRQVIGQGMFVTGVGITIGVAGAMATTRLLSSLLFGVSAGDLFIFTCAPLLMIVVAAAASYIPAYRASKVDPIVALRSE